MIKIRRIYDSEGTGEGYRVFTDRLWPRGISTGKAGWDEWMKDIAPTTQLRRWFGHDPSKWKEFRELYRKELLQNRDNLNHLKDLESKHGILTILYSAKDEDHNNAVVLRELLEDFPDK